MKKFFLLATILFYCSFVFSQNELEVHNSAKGLYLNHTVVAKENYYSIGRLYNIYPKDIESYNSLDMKKGLNIGQVIKIPLTTNNFSQKAPNGRAVYYEVGEKEGLYRVSLKNNGVLMADLRKWNHLANDNISAGKKLIVGYLISPEANNIVVTQPADTGRRLPEQPKPDIVAQDSFKEKKEEVVQVKEPERKPEPPASKPTSNTAGVNDGSGGYLINK
jgi:LysM repeat protein